MSSIGRITGRTSTSQFDFLVEGNVKKWDYVGFNHPSVGKVLAQVREIVKRNSETVANCEIIGYRNEKGFLRRPRTPPEPKSEIYLSDDVFLKNVLGLKEKGLYLGLLEGKDTLKSFIDPKKLITQHLAVLAKSGAGKSYAVGVLLEELAELKVPIVIIDPHGEYGSIKSPNTHAEDEKYFNQYDVLPKGFRNQIREFAVDTRVNPEAEKLKLPIPQTAAALISSLPFKITNVQRGLIYKAVEELKTKKSRFDFSDLIEELGFLESASKWNLITGLQNLSSTGMFSFNPTKARDLVKQGQMSIINLKGAPTEMQEMVVQVLSSLLFAFRKTDRVPPFFLIYEEAHNFCPERGFGEALSSKVVRSIASEGRKFGLGIAIISQRSARVDKNVLSQTASQIILQVTNPNDLKSISSSFEGVSSETEDEVKNLPIGKALVIGAADYPLFVDIRVRRSQHGGRAQTFNFAQTEIKSQYIKSIKTKPKQTFSSSQANAATLLAFRPRVMPKDIVMMEREDIIKSELVLRPCYSIRGGNNHVVVDAIKPAIYSFKDKLTITEIPDFVGLLSPVQRKIISAAATCNTIPEIFSKTNLNFSTVNSTVSNLAQKGMIKLNGKQVILHPVLKQLGNLRVSFSSKPEYIDLPGKKQQTKLSQSDVSEILNPLGIATAHAVKCYMPFYNVKLASGKTKLIDALSYSLKM